MKAILFSYDKKPFYKELPELSRKSEDEAILKVSSVGLCGSDTQKIRDNNYCLEGRVLGHEIVGVIKDISRQSGVKKGDRVAVNPLVPCYTCSNCQIGNYPLCNDLKLIGRELSGGFAEEIAVPQKNLYKLSQNLPDDRATLTDLLACAVHSMHLSRNPRNKNIAIIGDGPLGLILTGLLAYFGNNVTCIGKHDFNLDIARSLGAQKTTKVELLSNNLNNYFDKVYEAVGRNQADTLELAANLTRVRGELMVMGVYPKDYSGGCLRKLFYKEIKIQGSNCHGLWKQQNEFEFALSLLTKNLIDFGKLITQTVPLNKFETGLNAMLNKTNCVKVVYHV